MGEVYRNQKNNFKNALAADLCFTAAKPVKKVTGQTISKFAKKLENQIKLHSHFIIYFTLQKVRKIVLNKICSAAILFTAVKSTENCYLLKTKWKDHQKKK